MPRKVYRRCAFTEVLVAWQDFWAFAPRMRVAWLIREYSSVWFRPSRRSSTAWFKCMVQRVNADHCILAMSGERPIILGISLASGRLRGVLLSGSYGWNSGIAREGQAAKPKRRVPGGRCESRPKSGGTDVDHRG